MITSVLSRLAASMLLAGSALLIFATTSDASGVPLAATKHWTADNGNGTYSNPLFYGEFEDPDPIRVGNDYYLAGTTMHMNPAVEILHSKDLVNWELAGYCTNKLDLGPAYRLEDGGTFMAGASGRPASAITTGCFTFSAMSTAPAFRSSAPSQFMALGSTTNCPEGTTCRSSSMTTSTKSLSSPAPAPRPRRNHHYPIEELAPDLKSFDTNAPKHQMVIPPGAKDGRRPSPLQNQRQVLRHFRHSRRNGEPDGRQGGFH